MKVMKKKLIDRRKINVVYGKQFGSGSGPTFWSKLIADDIELGSSKVLTFFKNLVSKTGMLLRLFVLALIF